MSNPLDPDQMTAADVRSVRGKAPSAAGPCADCPRRGECRVPCERLESLLPGERKGEKFFPIPPEGADCAGHWRQEVGQKKREIFRIFLAHRERLTEAQWRCVELVYGEDDSLTEAGLRLGVSPAAVTQNLVAAYRRMLRKPLKNLRTSGGAHGRPGASSRTIEGGLQGGADT